VSTHGTLERIVNHLVGAVWPLQDAFSDTNSFRVLLLELGWDVPGLPPSYRAVAGKVAQAVDALQNLADEATVDELLTAIDTAGAVYRAIDALTEAPDGIDPAAFLPDLAERLFEYLLGQQLLAEAPGWYATMEMLGVIALEDHPAAGDRPGFTRIRFDWDQIPAILSDPGLIPARVYGWGTPDLNFPRIADLLTALVIGLGWPASLDYLSDELAAALQAQATGPPEKTARMGMTLVLFDLPVSGDSTGLVGLTVTELPAEGAALPGIVLLPQVPDGIADRVELGGGWVFTLRAETDLATQLGVVARPGGISVRYPGAPGRPLPSGGFGVALLYDAEQPLLIFGQPERTRMELSAASVAMGIDARGGDLELTATAGVEKLTLIVSPDDSDSFLASVLGGRELRIDLKFALAWSSRTGLDARTEAGVEVTLAPHLNLGVIHVDQVDLALQAVAGAGGALALQARASTAFSGKLGPVTCTVDRLGAQLPVTFTDGNAGPFDVRLKPLWPTGLGLKVAAGPVVGGGFLGFDPEREEYAGALELQFGQIGVKAIGVLTTGPGDWSLLLLLYAQIPPIQLSFGFTLEGIGGLIGLQRGVDITQLIAGMKTKAFDDILFPADPVGDAPRILGRLRTLFPARTRSLTIGPMVDVGWGTPRIVFIRVAVLLQLDNVLGSGGGPVALTRIVVVGQLRVAISRTEDDPDLTIVELIVDIIGFWDLADKRFGFLAVLRDSRIAGIDLTGGLGVWGEFGAHKRFLLAAGGFNPRFQDVPAEMSGVLDRLGASFSVGRFHLVLTGYFALTPATIQAGLNLSASAKIGSVGVKGEIGFDVLVYRNPRTHFIADFHIIAEVTYHGHTLAGVKVTGTIEGPGRWHLEGEVTFSILWWDISKSFDESWGSAAALERSTINVQALLLAELVKRENWSAQLPPGSEAIVTLAPHPGDLAPRAHPLGRFVFSQRVTPLGLTLEKYGDSAVSGPAQFNLRSVTIGGRPIGESTPVREHFARAQFLEMTEEEKLTRPSFEEMDAGVEFSSVAYGVSTHPLKTGIEYETAYLDLETQQTRRDTTLNTVALEYDLIEALARHGAAARAPQRATELMSTRARLRIAMSPPPLAAADRSALAADQAIAMDDQAGSVQMIAEQRLRTADAARLQIVEAFELVEA
jgi:hypothetical protein